MSEQHQTTPLSPVEIAYRLRESGLIDEDWYRHIYPDVAGSGLDPAIHYVTYGAKEGRNPNSHFNTFWYLSRYPDVAASEVNPLLHYVLDGAGEGRATSPAFDTAYYLAENPDLAGMDHNPLFHYLRYGLKEGRLGRSYAFHRRRSG